MRVVLLVVLVLVSGCDYRVSLVNTPTIDIDGSVVGLWQRTRRDGKTERLLILPINKKECMVSFPAGSEHAMYAHASLWRGPGITLVQLNWFGTAEGSLPKDDRTFQYAAYDVGADQIRIRMLNTAIVDRDIGSADSLVNSIVSNLDDPDLFRSEMVFQKTKIISTD